MNTLDDATTRTGNGGNREPILEVLCECCLRMAPFWKWQVVLANMRYFCPASSLVNGCLTPNQALVTALPHGAKHFPFDNLYPPLDLDVRAPIWPVETDTPD